MNKKLNLAFPILGISLMISGCSTTPSQAIFSKKTNMVTVYGNNQKIFGSPEHGYYNRSTYAGLQTAADATLASGNYYFTIITPSHLAQSMSNTAAEFLKECKVSYFGHQFNKDPCGFHITMNKTVLKIEVFKERPAKKLTYDAKSVISFLLEKKLYTEKNKITSL